MVTRFLVVCAVVSSGFFGCLFGPSNPRQEKSSTASPSSQTSAPVPQSRPKPDPQIQRLLATLGGTWSITEELAPDATSAKGKTGRGTIVWRPGPGGFSAIEEYRSKQGNEEITGLGAFWWDPDAQGFRTIWCDSTNPGGCIDFHNVARWTGSDLVLQEDYKLQTTNYMGRAIRSKRFLVTSLLNDLHKRSSEAKWTVR
jgi:hypothetical protein